MTISAAWLFVKKKLEVLREKGAVYWLTALCMIPLGLILGSYINKVDTIIAIRYALYQFLQEQSPHSPTHSKMTVLVLIDDDDYWKGELARRRPLKRDYLARLLRKLDAADPIAIGLDIDLRSQTLDGSMVNHPDYQRETEQLLASIRSASSKRTIVLARTIVDNPRGRGKILEPALFGDASALGRNVQNGFVTLSSDIRRVPLRVKLADASFVDSFALALVRCYDSKAVVDATPRDWFDFPFGAFIRESGFTRRSAGWVLRAEPEELKSIFSHHIVLVGGAWHEDMYGQGKIVDSRPSPVGDIGGTFVHGNYVETLLQNNVYKPSDERAAVVIDILLSVLIAVVFAMDSRLFVQIMYTIVLVIGLLLLSIASFQNFGRVFDFILPVVLVTLHAFAERVLEWRVKAREVRGVEGHAS